MKNTLHADYASSFFVLRTPMLPYAQALALYQRNREAPDALPDIILSACEDNMVQEALYIASPVLYSALQKFRQGGLPPREMKKAAAALWQYLVRMSTRCTPFGIFSGCAVGGFGNATRLELPGKAHIKRHMRLDMDHLCKIADFLTALNGLREQLVYYPNSSLYRYAQQLRFAQYTYKDGKREYHLVKFDSTPALNKVLRAARNGSTFGELVTLVAGFGVSEEEAAGYIHTLIEEQLLKSELEPNVSGPAYTDELIGRLQQHAHTEQIVQVLTAARNGMQHINQEAGISAYRQITGLLSLMPVPVDESRLFQVDTVRSVTHNQIAYTIATQVKEALLVLARLSNERLQHTRLEAFKRAFEERYGTQKVPLATALDVENGIGFQQAYSTEDHYREKEAGQHIPQTPAARFLLEKYRQALSTGAAEITITGEDVAGFTLDPADLPDSMGAVVSLYQGAAPEQPLIRLIGASPAAGKLLARFCHADETLATKVQEVARQEEALHPDKLYAEVLHLPQAKVGNILTRTHLRRYEIPYLCRSTLPPRYQLPVTDLYLQMVDGRLVLSSRRLGKEIIPQLTSAHNFTDDSLPVYHFLCSLEFQGKRTGLSWNWGWLSQEPFLPRVRYGNVILKPATWNVRSDAFKSLHLRKPDAACFAQFACIKASLSLPDQVLLAEGDNELLLDLQTPMGIQLLIDATRQQSMVVLYEVLARPDNLLAHSQDGALANELIIPFVRTQPVAHTPAPRRQKPPAPEPPVERYFPPGSSWIYYKLYTGEKTADDIIRQVLYPFARKLLRKRAIDQWFFIRYRDPHHHIRVRWHVRDANDPSIISAFRDAILPYFEKGLVSRLQIDTYEREVERYGPATIGLFEKLFCISSTCISRLLLQCREEGELRPRRLAGLLWIDGVMTALHYSLPAKAAFYERCFSSFTAEFRFHEDKKEREALSNDYRELQPLITQCMHTPADAWPSVAPLIQHFLQKARPVLLNILRLYRQREESYDYALRSYLHMYMNSLMTTEQRREEYRVYFYLSKHYASQVARQTTTARQPEAV